MKQIFYKKVGRKYIPVSEYDSDFLDSFPEGNHLVMCYPGGKSRRYKINPNHAALIAAGRVAEDAMRNAMLDASEHKPPREPLTPEEIKAWKNLIKVWGDRARTLRSSSIQEVVDVGVKALILEAEKLLQNPAVKNAYEHFLVVSELSKNSQEK